MNERMVYVILGRKCGEAHALQIVPDPITSVRIVEVELGGGQFSKIYFDEAVQDNRKTRRKKK